MGLRLLVGQGVMVHLHGSFSQSSHLGFLTLPGLNVGFLLQFHPHARVQNQEGGIRSVEEVCEGRIA